jgi:hypothetical protein
MGNVYGEVMLDSILKKSPGIQLINLRQAEISPGGQRVPREPGNMVSSEEGFITVKIHPLEILVHQSPLRARLYLFSLTPLIPEVIIRKNAEPGRNKWAFSGGNE